MTALNFFFILLSFLVYKKINRSKIMYKIVFESSKLNSIVLNLKCLKFLNYYLFGFRTRYNSICL